MAQALTIHNIVSIRSVCCFWEECFEIGQFYREKVPSVEGGLKSERDSRVYEGCAVFVDDGQGQI